MTTEKPVSLSEIVAAKGQKKLVMVTAYDYTSARLVDAAGVDMILVGDSLGMTMLGNENTIPVTLHDMIHHAKAVRRGCRHALVVCDMPFMTYEIGCREALKNAGRLFQKSGVRAVKLEGGMGILPQVRALVEAGIPVMGHIGLTPQRVACLGGFKVQAKTAEAALSLFETAQALEEAGCFALVLEAVPACVAQKTTSLLRIPTIGIGAGAGCDGQVLVFQDLLGLNPDFTPRFAKQYIQAGQLIREAVETYADEVRASLFPSAEHAYSMPRLEEEKLLACLENRLHTHPHMAKKGKENT